MEFYFFKQIRYRWAILLLLFGCGALFVPQQPASADRCPDLQIIFARGSGGVHDEDANYLEFKNTIETKLQTTTLSYEFSDLDYPAVAVGLDNFETSIGALVGSGDAYEFGASVDTGVNLLVSLINHSSCSNTRFVIGGYSQGAMVVSKALHSLNEDKIIYAATFGDPKIYLPEGAGLFPDACRGENLSDYRAYVPDCQTYKGLLGSYEPYQPVAYLGKLGTWCNKSDIFCSSHLSLNDHLAYVSDALYEDASRVIFDKITEAFNIENDVTSPHDTAILIDSTGSMASMIDQYKAEALRLATETIESGGRIALYDYRDLDDPYNPVKHCDFSTCTLDVFKSKLASIRAVNGGDAPESLLSASVQVMKELSWNYGSTKSLVILTDADFLNPDRDGITFDDAVKLSKSIDPVNFYIITQEKYSDTYQSLASSTDGKVFTDFNKLNLLTDFILERYDSLPRVEEDESPSNRPTIDIVSTTTDSINTLTVNFNTTGDKTLIILNDVVLGYTTEHSITISDLDRTLDNTVQLIATTGDDRGATASYTLNAIAGKGAVEPTTSTVSTNVPTTIIPKAPNTGIVH